MKLVATAVETVSAGGAVRPNAVGPAGKWVVSPRTPQTAITPWLGSKSTLEPPVHAADLGAGHVPRAASTGRLETTVIKSVANRLICKFFGGSRRLQLDGATSCAAEPPPAI